MRRRLSLILAIAIMLSFAFVGSGRGTVEAAGSSKDVYIASYAGITRLPGACLELVPYSNVGCDVNRDGYVQLAAIPAGTYTLVYTSVPAGYALPPEQLVTVPRGPDRVFYFDVHLASTTGTVDVSIVAYDDASGDWLTGACFSLRGYSNVGCDVNGDGQVEFADIPYGTWQIDVERFPTGTALAYPAYQAYIVVSPYDGSHWQGSVLFTYD